MRLALCLALAAVAAAQPPKKAPPPPAIPAPQDLKFPPLRPIQIPKVETFTLSNGMKVYLLEDHELPLVSGTARVRTGNLFDPRDKIGLATVTGMVLRSGGTRTRTGDQLDEILENIAANVESSIGETSGSVSFSALKENADEVLTIFQEVLTTPEFRQDKIELARSQLRSSISRRNDNPAGITSREFNDIVYGRDNAYGWRMEYEHLARITREDLLGFYRRYYFPANILLAVWGDFPAAEMRAKLEKTFAGWGEKQPPVPPFPQVDAKAAPGVHVAVKRDTTQTFFAIGHLGGVLRDQDYPALEIMADILGGGFRSRLVQRIRTKMGAAYSVSADWGANYHHPGLFEVNGSTQSVQTQATLQAVLEEIERIRTTEVADQELETARQSALNSLVFAFDTKAKTLGRMLTYEYYGYPADFIQQYQKALAAVTKADILRVAKDRLHPGELTIVAVGEPGLDRTLATLGLPVASIDLTIPEPKVERVAATPENVKRGAELLAGAQAAVGGAARLKAIKDMTQVMDFQSDPAAGGLRGKQTNRWLAPNHFRQDLDLPIGQISTYTDGKSGWMAQGKVGFRPLSGPVLQQAQGELFRAWVPLLLAEGRTPIFAGDHTVEIADAQGQTLRLTLDQSTVLPQRLVYEMAGQQGAPVTVETVFADYREVEGVKFPFRVAVRRDGKPFGEATVQDIKLNTGLTAEDLSRRP